MRDAKQTLSISVVIFILFRFSTLARKSTLIYRLLPPFYLFFISLLRVIKQLANKSVEKTSMRIAILTSGGDCPGINATIRGACKTAINHYGMEVLGIHSGFQGLLTGDAELLTDKSLSGLLNLGGTILGTSREKPFKKGGFMSNEDKPALIEANIRKMGIDCLICIGGNGTQKTAAKLLARGINVVSIPKTIDNDIWGTDCSFGFDSAVNIATDAIDRLHSTASSHKRVMVIEVMGHKAGWIALYSGMAGGGDVILIPEIPYHIDHIADTILNRLKKGKPYSIVVVAEGIQTGDNKRAAIHIAQEIEYATGIETRETVLGYIQRGGSPTPFDRNLSTRMGGHATELIANGTFGRMVALTGDKISSIPLEEVAGKLKLVTEQHDLVVQGRRMGICFG
jgi:6-phosphofructokinase 1